MANFETVIGSGTLFVNQRKENESHPDYKGTINIAGTTEDIGAWLRKDEGKEIPYMRVICSTTKTTFRLDLQQREEGKRRPDYKGNFKFNEEDWECAGWLGETMNTKIPKLSLKLGKREHSSSAVSASAPTAFPTWENGGNVYNNPTPVPPQAQTAPANTAYPQGPQIPAPAAPENIDDIPF